MATRAEARELRGAQAGISALLERDLRSAFGRLDLSNPTAARDAMLDFTPRLVAQYGEVAATMAADWYETVRASTGVAGRFRVNPTVVTRTDEVVGTVRRVAGQLFTATPETAIDSLVPRASQYALDSARETVRANSLRDPRARGWERVTNPGACDFCVDLANRGAAYSEDSADFEAHDGCNCIAAPAFN